MGRVKRMGYRGTLIGEQRTRILKCHGCGYQTDGSDANWVRVHRIGVNEASDPSAPPNAGVLDILDPGTRWDFCGMSCMLLWAQAEASRRA